ncbi:hypothetical protein MMC11_008480 [Xylographa trunciseda]|nr:hypothetical protein [Xylographa trunciseda]
MQKNLHLQGGPDSGIADKTLPRACEACRARKIRCFQDRSFSEVQCKPCLFSNRACVYSDPSLRKRRKRTDARVAELEKTVKALSTALHGGVNGDLAIQGDLDTMEGSVHGHTTMEKPIGKLSTSIRKSSPALPKVDESYNVDATLCQPSNSPSRFTAADELAAPQVIDSAHDYPQADVVSRGLLSMTEASFLFDVYVSELSPYYPDIVLPRGQTLRDIRMKKPVLFLAIITAASSAVDAQLNAQLTTELRHVFANRVFMNGDKSIELVQALLITTSWSYPSVKYDEAKFYQLIHMTATMALEIGLGKKTGGLTYSPQLADCDNLNLAGPPFEGTSWQSTPTRGPLLRPDISEGCRAIVSCYVKCSGVSLGLCRPSMLRFSDWISERVNMLEYSWDAPVGDRKLAAWARLAHVMEEFRTIFASDDSNITVSLVEPRIQHMLRAFKNQLEMWRGDLIPDVIDQSLEIYYHYCKIYMYTISMHLDYGVEEFQPPYLVKFAIEPSESSDLPTAYIEALSICSGAARDLINTFLRTEVQVLRLLPTVTYVRMTYAITVLVKLSVAAASSGSIIGKFVDSGGLQVSQYLEKLISHLSIAAGKNRNRVATIFLAIIGRLKCWYRKEDRVELCLSCCLIDQESGSNVQGSPANGTMIHTPELENAPTTIAPATSVLSMQCIYTPSCSSIYAAKANSQAPCFSCESINLAEPSLDDILAMNSSSTSTSDDFLNCALNVDWYQPITNGGNDLPTEESSGWALGDTLSAI